MNIAWIIAALLIGIALGVFYYWGLWVTTRSLITSQRPAWLLALSFVARAGLVLLAFYLVMDGRWERLLACMAGFLLARTILIRQLHPDVEEIPQPTNVRKSTR